MKTISLKIQDRIFTETENILNGIKKSRNGYINDAIAFYNAYQRRKLIERQLIVDSEMVAGDSLNILMEMEQLEDEY